MEIPDWVAKILTWVTAFILSVTLLLNLTQGLLEQKLPRQPRPRLFSRARLAHYARSFPRNWSRFFKTLWAATESTAHLTSRVGVLVVLAVTLVSAISMFLSAPYWQWLWTAPISVAVVCGCVMVNLSRKRDDPGDDEPDSGSVFWT